MQSCLRRPCHPHQHRSARLPSSARPILRNQKPQMLVPPKIVAETTATPPFAPPRKGSTSGSPPMAVHQQQRRSCSLPPLRSSLRWCCTVLSCAAPCAAPCAALCCSATPCYTVLRRATPCYAVLRRVLLFASPCCAVCRVLCSVLRRATETPALHTVPTRAALRQRCFGPVN